MSFNGRAIFRYLMFTGLKLSLAVVTALALYLIYLDSTLTQRFTNERVQAPALVYARSLSLQPGQHLSLEQLKQELELLRYRDVSHVQESGQYRLTGQAIELYRRPFDFFDGPQMAQRVRIELSQQRVDRIVSLPDQRSLNGFALEPALIGRIAADNNEERLLVGLEMVPNLLIETLLLIEDRDFYHHSGISLTSIGRAALANLAAMRTVQGGSTLTQQLVKNLYLTRERSLWRKAKEAFMALIIDYRFSKNEILEAYLNEVYFGQDRGYAIHGIGLASRFYFGKQVQELSIDEMALLVAMVKGPSYYDPRRYPQRAQERRDLILQLLLAQSLISQTDYVTAVNAPIAIQKNQRLVAQSLPHYMELVRHELGQQTTNSAWQEQGLRIFTYHDPYLQDAAEQALQQQLPKLSKDTELQGAVVLSDHHNAGISAVVGDRNPRLAGFNRAVAAIRPIGSLIKPFIYANAFASGRYELASIIADSPMTLANSVEQQQWSPENFDGEYRGDMLLYDALVQSRNVPAVRLGMEVGIDRLIQTLQRGGVDTPIPEYPSLTLGTVALAPLAVNELYASLAQAGQHRPLRTIQAMTNHDGVLLFERTTVAATELFDDASAALLNFGLRGVVNEGTGKALAERFGTNALAGKSGTTNDFRDSWFSAYDQQYVVTVWLGRDDNQPIYLTGASGALPVVSEIFEQIQPQPLQLVLPASLELQNFHRQKGVLIPVACESGVLLPAQPRVLPERQTCAGEQAQKPWWQRIF